jgi:hypothetical protein
MSEEVWTAKYSDKLMTFSKIEHLKAQNTNAANESLKSALMFNAVHRSETQTL